MQRLVLFIMSATLIPMCTIRWSYCEALYHSIRDISLNIMTKNCKQNTLENTHENALQAKFFDEKGPLNKIIRVSLSVIISKSV